MDTVKYSYYAMYPKLKGGRVVDYKVMEEEGIYPVVDENENTVTIRKENGEYLLVDKSLVSIERGN